MFSYFNIFNPQELNTKQTMRLKRPINNNSNNDSAKKSIITQKKTKKTSTILAEPTEKSIYLYIALHGSIIFNEQKISKPIKEKLVEVKIPKTIKHITKLTNGVFGCYNIGTHSDTYSSISKIKKYIEQYLKRHGTLYGYINYLIRPKSLYDIYGLSKNEYINLRKDYIDKYEIDIIGLNKQLREKENLRFHINDNNNIKQIDEDIKKIKLKIKKKEHDIRHFESELEYHNLFGSQVYREFTYDSVEPVNEQILFNKSYSRRLTDLLKKSNNGKRPFIENDISYSLKDTAIFILHDSLDLFKDYVFLKEKTTTQELLNILSKLGYTHIYLIDQSCNSLSGYNTNNNNTKFKEGQNYKSFQLSSAF